MTRTKEQRTNYIQLKKAQLTILERLFRELNEIEESYTKEYKETGETRQVKTWRGELVWEDEEQTVPKMEKVYDYFPIPDSEMSEEQKAIRDALPIISAALEKMI